MVTDRQRILIVEDDQATLRMLVFSLEKQRCYESVTASTGAEAVKRLHESNPDLVILDILLPDMDGFEVCRRIRLASAVPVIMLTGLTDEGQIVRGLDAGADEYVTKPFSLAELHARIRAALRRVDLDRNLHAEQVMTCDGGKLSIDFYRRTVTRGAEQVSLSDTEFRLLSVLAANAGQVVEHQRIIEHVWGPNHSEDTGHLRVYVLLLRRKIEADPRRPRLIVSMHSVGYFFNCD